ncbi:MAG: hypothetical protein ABI348_02360 [Nitrososphaera sp.]
MIVGVAGLFFGIGFIAQDAILHPLVESAIDDLPRRNLSAEQGATPGFGIALGAAFLPLAIVSFIVASALLKGRRWAWTASLVLSIISMAWYAFTVVTIPSNGGRTLGVIIGAVTIYCLYRPHVKAYLGKRSEMMRA